VEGAQRFRSIGVTPHPLAAYHAIQGAHLTEGTRSSLDSALPHAHAAPMPCGEGQPAAGHPQPAAEVSASSPTGEPSTRTAHSEVHFPLLVGVHRRSLCCGAHVYHPAPASARRLGAATTLLCASCHHFARFEVVNAFGDRIWPVPKWFTPPPPTPSRVIYGADLSTYALALPNRVLRTLFR
jgi:hypothetical protein